jgi:sugar lactone lactonase YvrE
MKKLLLLVSALISGITTTAQNINTLAGNSVKACNGVGIPATSANLNAPSGIAIDASGNVYFGDVMCHRIRKINTSGIISTAIDSTHGADAQGIAIDASGNIYFIDNSQHVKMMNTSGVITTVAGSGTTGYNGDGISAITADMEPNGIAVDNASNIYIADRSGERIRKVTGGIVTTVAGTGSAGFSGDNNPAISAQINNPLGVAVDGAGNLYIVDNGNVRIRKVDASGVITTVAGGGSVLGDGGLATAGKLFYPKGVAVDATGNIYIGDITAYRIRKINTSGIITTIAGTGLPGYSGDGGPATAATIYGSGAAGMGPLAVDAMCNVYFTENMRVRVISVGGCLSEIQQHQRSNVINIYPNPTTDKLAVTIETGNEVENYTVTDQLGRIVLSGKLTSANAIIDVHELGNGIYVLHFGSESSQSVKLVKY